MATAKELGKRLRRRQPVAANGPTGDSAASSPLPPDPGLDFGAVAPTLLRSAQVAVSAGIALLAAVPVLALTPSWAARTAGLGYLALLVAVQLTWLSRRIRRYGPLALLAQAGLGYLPMLQFGTSWSVLSGFFAGGLLLMTRPLVAVPCAVAVVTGAGVLTGFTAPVGIPGLTAALCTAVTALTVFGLTWSAWLAAERAETLRELTRRAVTEERMRFSRDVHDLLGLSLSAITLKGELINRLIADQPQRAMEELADILDMSRKALADVRSVAAGYRELSLADECLAAACVLRAAGVEVLVDRAPADLCPAVATALATVLREGVTNVIRHSKATWCRLSVRASGGATWLVLVNDGVTEGSGTGPGGGNGLRNLASRLGALGGELSAGAEDDGTYRLAAHVPPAVARDERRAG